MARKLAGITDAAVMAATGENWGGWLGFLDERGGEDLNHKEIVGILEDAGIDNPWWQQQIAVGYEQARGMREVGETAGAGFEIGVQRTLPISKAHLWNALLSAGGRRIWLGESQDFEVVPGATYDTADGIIGELRTVKENERLRLTWQLPEWDTASTLQLTLACPRTSAEKTVLRIHQEKLADGEIRERMRERWRTVLDELETHIANEFV